jgi:hypothetical protein
MMASDPITPRKLLSVRLIPHRRNPGVAALELTTDGGSVAFAVNRKTLEELADALRARAAKMPYPGGRTPAALPGSDTFEFVDEPD